MSVVIKTIGNKKYAYQAYRKGDRVIHRYLGKVSDKNVLARIEEIKTEKQVPLRFYPLFWDVAPDKISIRTDAKYIVERVLETGTLEAFQWLQKLYPTKLIAEICAASRKISEKSKIFWKIWLGGYGVS
jgi:hypothetical protein